MKILLDTQAFLWISMDAPQLSNKAKKIFLDDKNEFLLSLASIWEITIKTSIKKLALTKSVKQFILGQFEQMPITQLNISFRHVVYLETLPFYHRDPFDRLLISQSLEDKLPVLSSDKIFDKYGIKRVW